MGYAKRGDNDIWCGHVYSLVLGLEMEGVKPGNASGADRGDNVFCVQHSVVQYMACKSSSAAPD